VKKKDLVFLVIAVCILLVAGYIVYSQLLPKKPGANASTVQVETAGSLPSSIDSNGLSQMTQSQMRDFNSPVDYSGLNNTEPFGQ
jgi:hypothetical protein